MGKKTIMKTQKKLFEPLTNYIKNTSEKLSKTITETSINNIKAIEKLNEKTLEVMIDKGMIAPYFAFSSADLFTPENKSQFRLTETSTQLR